MWRFIQKFRAKLYDESVPLHERLTRMSLSMVAIVIAIMMVESAVVEHNVFLVLANLVGETFIVISLYISIKKSNYNLASIILFASTFLVSLPIMFFTGGGIRSASSEWYLFSIVMTFVLLRGVPAVAMFVLGSVSYISIIIIAYENQQLVHEFATVEEIYTDFGVSTGLIVFCLAAVFSIQVKEYERDRVKLEEQKRVIEETAKSKDSFFANMSHEIKTPINTIIGLNEMILRSKPSKDIVENALDIQNASKTLLTLINDVLDMSKIETGRMEIVPAQYAVAKMISDIVNENWLRAQEKGLDFKLDLAKDVPSVLWGDEVRIRQVVSNLVSNAIKYTKEGQIVLSIRSEQTEDKLVNFRISVSDTGIGIKKEALDVLFDAFTRTDAENAKMIEGYGLGLSISKSLLDIMGGKISVDSIYTKGSTFSVSIPQRIVDNRPVAKKDLVIKKSVDEYKNYHQSFEASKAKALVVDDNAMNLAVTAKLLSSTKMQIYKAASGAEALVLTEGIHFDVILMDHLMPDMDGIETMHAIRKQIGGQCLDSPVIALTANAGENAESIYKGYGFQGYLSKPISGDLLESMVYRFLPQELIEYSVSMDIEDRDEFLDEFKKSIETEKKPLVIAADCTSDIPTDIMKSCGIGFMYYNVYIDDKRYRDTLEISSENINEILAQGKEVISLPAEVEEYEEFFGHLLTEAEQVIHFTIGKNSGVAYSVASDAAKCFGNVHIIDSGTLTGGMGLLAMAASEQLKKGKDVDYILNYIESAKKKVSTSFLLQNVENMYKTHKISAGAYFVCKSLHLKPVLVMKNSEIRVGGVCTGGVLYSTKMYIKRTFKNANDINTKVLVMNYVGLSAREREAIKKEVAKYIHFETIIEQPASGTIAIYCGENVFSFSFFRK